MVSLEISRACCRDNIVNRYHFHFHPKTRQLGLLLQLGIGMTIDLGISQKRKKPLIHISGEYGSRPIDTGKEREAQRAFLGCYYLSTASVLLFNPNSEWVLRGNQICSRAKWANMQGFCSGHGYTHSESHCSLQMICGMVCSSLLTPNLVWCSRRE